MISLDELKKEALDFLDRITDEEALRNFELTYLGRKQGRLTAILRGLSAVAVHERAKIGKDANEFRQYLENKIAEMKKVFAQKRLDISLQKESIDVTIPARSAAGHLHPLTHIRRKAESVFIPLGFAIAEGPEIETDFYNFDALNMPPDHPARDFWDTFWIDEGRKEKRNKHTLLLRTHISSIQVRYMKSHQPPYRIIAPGPVYRYEASDASHDSQFDYMEGLLVDKDVTVGHLRYILLLFFRSMFGERANIRLRPSYFPFVEPGFEVDISCVHCHGKGCGVCKGTGWVELAGAGIVHQNVFKAAGYVKGEWQGLAFGVGLDRIAMMKYGIPDIRLFRTNDLRFIKQF